MTLGIFENTVAFGSILGVLLLGYCQNTAIEVLRLQHTDQNAVMTARVLHGSVGTVFALAALPCIVWPAIYVALFDGVLAGLVAWVTLQLVGAFATMVLSIRGGLLPLHLLIGLVALPTGYYLTLTNAPWG